MWADAVSGKLLVRGADAFDHAHDVGLLHNQEVLAVDLDFRPRPFAEQDSVACFQFQTLKLAALVAGAGPHSDDLALLRFLLDSVGNDDAALRLVLAFHAADHDAVVQWSEFHGIRFQSTGVAGSWATTLALGGSPTQASHGHRWHSLQVGASRGPTPWRFPFVWRYGLGETFAAADDAAANYGDLAQQILAFEVGEHPDSAAA